MLQATKYFEYQSRYSYFWFKQSKMPGQYTRLLSAHGPDHLMKVIVYCIHRVIDDGDYWSDHSMQEVPTHVAPPHDMSKVIMPIMILMIFLSVLPTTKM